MRVLQDVNVGGRRYRVYASGIRRFVRTGDGNHVQSVVLPAGWRTGYYYDQMATALDGAKSVLILGNGAGSLANLLASGPRVVAVEPDPVMNRIAAELGTARHATIVEQDAMTYLKACPVTFDGVAVDCYVDDAPAADFEDIVAAARAAVTPGGVLVVNRHANGREVVESERIGVPSKTPDAN